LLLVLLLLLLLLLFTSPSTSSPAKCRSGLGGKVSGVHHG
jgi:hypothetical protein